MSKQLLYNLNGGKNGAFRNWLAGLKGEPRIAWYPSAGKDFRDLLYLHPGFAERSQPTRLDPSLPNIFLHTDYFAKAFLQFIDNRTLHIDKRTSVIIKSLEELPRCDLPLDSQIVHFSSGSTATGRVLFLEIEIQSNVFGVFTRPVIYAFVENAAFCAEKILPQQGRLSHIIHVRYGGGCGGGGKSTGIWLLNILQRVNCECFITDDHFGKQKGDKRVYELYPNLSGPESVVQLERIRTIKSEGWSNHGDVSWSVLQTD